MRGHAASRTCRLTRRLGAGLLPFLLGGCFLFPPSDIARLAPAPRYDAAIKPFHYPGADGSPIEGFFALPAGTGAPTRSPCLLFLHGQIGFWRSYRIYAQQLARLGFGVLYINYYSARVVDLKESIRPFDERVRRLRLMLEDMARGVDALAAHPRCEADGVAVVGFSLGGSYAFHVAALRPRKVAAIVSFYGGYRFKPLMKKWDVRLLYLFGDEDGRRWQDWIETQDPAALIGKIHAPVLLLHGRADNWVPPRQAEDFLAALRARGIPSELMLLEEQDHDFMFNFNPRGGQMAVRRLVNFLERRVVASLRNGCRTPLARAGANGARPGCRRDAPSPRPARWPPPAGEAGRTP